MKTYYQITGFNKFAEQDIYNDGCQPDTAQSFFVDHLIQQTSLDDLIKKAMNFLGIDDAKNVMLNSCEEQGRIDLQVYETDDGYPANDVDKANWKAGNKRLWLVCYSAQVSIIQENDCPDLKALVSDNSIYSE